MRFDLGWRDRLFGEKIELELPMPDGKLVKRKVSKKWCLASYVCASCIERVVHTDSGADVPGHTPYSRLHEIQQTATSSAQLDSMSANTQV